MRRGRHERTRRNLALIAAVVVLAFAAGYLLPGLLMRLLPALFGALAPGADWSSLPQVPPILSLAIGFAVAARVGTTLLGPSRGETAWGRGASGERTAGRVLDALTRQGIVVLHDRRLPSSTANVDHVVVAPAGVFTVETKLYAGRLEVRGLGSELWIKGRNRSRVLGQALGQAEVIRTLLTTSGHEKVPVTPALCFVETEIPLLTPMRVGGVLVGTPRSVRRRIGSSRAVLGEEEVSAIANLLDTSLGPNLA